MALFPDERQRFLGTYDAIDVSDGTGVTTLYGAVYETSAGQTYGLSKEAFYSTEIEDTVNIVAGDAATKRIDYDFDLAAFQLPKDVSGTAKINHGIAITGRAGETCEFYVTYVIKHYDGSTETTIGTATSQTISENAANTTQDMVLLEISLTDTHFKKGDILRLTVEGYCTGVGAGNTGDMHIGYDPQNRDGTAITPSTDPVISQLVLYMPFEVEQ